MSAPLRRVSGPRRRPRRAIEIWLIALLVALVATVQIRSQAEVERSLVGALVLPPWTISVIGDTNRLAEAADLMTQQMRSDRRVRQATYRVESDVAITSVITQRPFVYANP